MRNWLNASSSECLLKMLSALSLSLCRSIFILHTLSSPWPRREHMRNKERQLPAFRTVSYLDRYCWRMSLIGPWNRRCLCRDGRLADDRGFTPTVLLGLTARMRSDHRVGASRRTLRFTHFFVFLFFFQSYRHCSGHHYCAREDTIQKGLVLENKGIFFKALQNKFSRLPHPPSSPPSSSSFSSPQPHSTHRSPLSPSFRCLPLGRRQRDGEGRFWRKKYFYDYENPNPHLMMFPPAEGFECIQFQKHDLIVLQKVAQVWRAVIVIRRDRSPLGILAFGESSLIRERF